jgi:hypothetical protein
VYVAVPFLFMDKLAGEAEMMKSELGEPPPGVRSSVFVEAL